MFRFNENTPELCLNHLCALPLQNYTNMMHIHICTCMVTHTCMYLVTNATLSLTHTYL